MMTPEERFTRIENNLDRLEVKLDSLAERVDTFVVWVEKSLHGHDGRLRKLEEMQIVLMESQNATFRAIDRLTENVEKLIRGRGSNGHE